MKIVIATLKRPTSKDQFDKLCAAMRATAKEHDLIVLPGIYWTYGDHCYNLAFEVRGDDDKSKSFAEAMTLSLMPARWGETTQKLHRMDTLDIEPGLVTLCESCGVKPSEPHLDTCPLKEAV